MTDRALTLRVLVQPLPDPRCPGFHGIELGIQRARVVLFDGKDTANGRLFCPEVRVRRGKGGVPKFLGPYAQGTPKERFLYLVWGFPEPSQECPGAELEVGSVLVSRRLKLFLGPVLRASWSQPGITWRQIEEAESQGHGLETPVSGVGADGTPACDGFQVEWLIAGSR